MTAPLPANPYLRRAVEALPGYAESLQLVEQADHWLRQQPGIPDVDPVLKASIGDAWLDAERAHQAAHAEYQSRRQLVQARRQAEANRAQSILTSGQDLILGALAGDLTQLLGEVADIVPALHGSATAEQAVANDAGQVWKSLTELAGDYQSIRTAQEWVMLRGNYGVWKSCTPAMPGDDHANQCYLRNIGELWPTWRQPGMRTRRIELGNEAPTPQRDEPWPRDEYSAEMLVYLTTSSAQPWLPTTRQLREFFAERAEQPDVDEHQDDEPPFERSPRLLGPAVSAQRKQPPNADHYSRIAPAISNKTRPVPPELQGAPQ